MTLDPEGRRFRYILLATNRTGTMQNGRRAEVRIVPGRRRWDGFP